jgi:hypothetical protein
MGNKQQAAKMSGRLLGQTLGLNGQASNVNCREIRGLAPLEGRIRVVYPRGDSYRHPVLVTLIFCDLHESRVKRGEEVRRFRLAKTMRPSEGELPVGPNLIQCVLLGHYVLFLILPGLPTTAVPMCKAQPGISALGQISRLKLAWPLACCRVLIVARGPQSNLSRRNQFIRAPRNRLRWRKAKADEGCTCSFNRDDRDATLPVHGYGQRATLSRQVADTSDTCRVLPASQVGNMSWRPPLRSSIAPV